MGKMAGGGRQKGTEGTEGTEGSGPALALRSGLGEAMPGLVAGNETGPNALGVRP